MKVRILGGKTERMAAETARLRLMIGGAMFAAAFLAISARLVDLAVLNQGASGPQLASRFVVIPEPMSRADIVDRNGVLLATNLNAASLYANPHLIPNAGAAADALLSVLPELNRDDVISKLTSANRFVWLKRGLTPDQLYQVNRLGIPGFEFEYEQRRVYPNGALTAHVIGFSDVDNKGLAGIEQIANDRLTDRTEPLALSLDIRVQQILHEEVAAQIETFGAIGGGGLVLDVHTGEVIAMVSLPDFDPNLPAIANDDQRFNRMSYGVYEFGSVFKLFTLATALETGSATVNSQYDATHPIQISRFTIRDYKPQARVLSFTEVLLHSSNIGAAKIAIETGSQAQRQYLGNLGLLTRTDIELPERGAPLYPREWRDINTMTIGFGHGIAVTPVHLAVAVATLVNGGEYHPPTIFRSNADTPIESRRVYSRATSVRMRSLMRMVVAEGTGGKAEAPGYLVGGKTGTAEKTGPGGYDGNRLVSSFLGVFPIDAPRYVVLAIIDEPKGVDGNPRKRTGGWVAAPVVARVIARAGMMLGVEPVEETTPDDALPALRIMAGGNRIAVE